MKNIFRLESTRDISAVETRQAYGAAGCSVAALTRLSTPIHNTFVVYSTPIIVILVIIMISKHHQLSKTLKANTITKL